MVKQANKSAMSLHRLPLYQQLQSLICGYITENKLRPDDPLPAEGDLAELFGVSRNSVREAVKSLQVLGVLVSRPGSGLFVGEFSFDPIVDNLPYAIVVDYRDLADLLEVRRTLEVGMVDQILSSRTDEQIDELGEIIEKWKRAITKDNEAYPADLDRAFHAALNRGGSKPACCQAAQRVLASLLPGQQQRAAGCTAGPHGDLCLPRHSAAGPEDRRHRRADAPAWWLTTGASTSGCGPLSGEPDSTGPDGPRQRAGGQRAGNEAEQRAGEQRAGACGSLLWRSHQVGTFVGRGPGRDGFPVAGGHGGNKARIR